MVDFNYLPTSTAGFSPDFWLYQPTTNQPYLHVPHHTPRIITAVLCAGVSLSFALRIASKVDGRWEFLPSFWTGWYGGFQKYGYPQIINSNRVFPYEPSILGYPYFWKPPYFLGMTSCKGCIYSMIRSWWNYPNKFFDLRCRKNGGVCKAYHSFRKIKKNHFAPHLFARPLQFCSHFNLTHQ